jgi:hypothetical protein
MPDSPSSISFDMMCSGSFDCVEIAMNSGSCRAPNEVSSTSYSFDVVRHCHSNVDRHARLGLRCWCWFGTCRIDPFQKLSIGAVEIVEIDIVVIDTGDGAALGILPQRPLIIGPAG